jgi:thiazole/oxazole-forming peptide maturase SagD family component
MADQDSLDLYKASLAPAIAAGELYEFGFTPIDRLDVPLWTVALFPPDGALCDGFGYGPTLTAAQASAWGETVEWYFAREALKAMPRRRASYNELQRQGRAAVDPVPLCLEAGSRYTPDTPLVWIEAKRHPSNETVLVPIEAAAPRIADIVRDDRDRDQFLMQVPITNGLGAGPSFEHALAHGILELLQRDGNSVNYRALDQGVAIELDDVRDHETRSLLDQLKRDGVNVIVKLAATDFGFANLYVVGVDDPLTLAPQPITLSACGEAVHPDRERALAKALREYTMARARKPFNHGPLDPIREIAPAAYLDAFTPSSHRNEDDRALREMQRWTSLDHRQFHDMLQDRVLAVRSTVRFSDLPTVDPAAVADPADLLALLCERLTAEELEILYVPFTAPDHNITVLRALVPGLEVETMTYRRIGRRNMQRLTQRESPIVGVGDAPPHALPVALRPADEAVLGGPAWLDPQALDREVGPLYALYREPSRHVIGFLKEQGNKGAKEQGQ